MKEEALKPINAGYVTKNHKLWAYQKIIEDQYKRLKEKEAEAKELKKGLTIMVEKWRSEANEIVECYMESQDESLIETIAARSLELQYCAKQLEQILQKHK